MAISSTTPEQKVLIDVQNSLLNSRKQCLKVHENKTDQYCEFEQKTTACPSVLNINVYYKIICCQVFAIV